ncbi:MAG TPA: DUF4062 domain-containing protein, partial [Blastocatellia bacterium]|nr:DUF4062 domain-containing protein [Blastocatellia bacterium]
MTRKWKTVRVFISSTFRDMHAERDHLVRFVFPELRERCAKRRLHLVDVDLRWGVTEDEAEQGRVLEVCLDEIERCRPFFVGLLGERYGWVPPRYNVPDEPSYDWVRDFQPGHSITAIEIYHGVLRDPEAHARAFFYFRDPAFISEVPAQHQAIFLPDNEQAKSKLDELKDEIRRHCVVRENYQCGYGGTDATGNVMLTGLEAFGRHVLEDLWAAIGQEYPEHQTFVDELAIERAYHEAFIESRSQRFIGRQDLLSRMFEYLDDEASVLVVTGAAGCGKSALLANFASQYASHPEVFVLPHFIGVSPRSTDLHRTLLRLCRELAERFQIADEIPEDYQELRQKMPGILEEACSRANVLLILDGLNQLDESHYAHSMNWLPQTLPRRLKLIASTLEGECLDALRSRKPTPEEIVIGALDLEDRKRIVGQTLGDYRKRLDEDRVDERYGNTQMGLLLTKRESDNPLYLIVACEELRVFGDFERLMERIAGLPDDVAGLFEQVLRRLEGDQGEELVRSALSLLECSRHGLLESEMLQLLARAGEEQLPPSIWARLYRSLQFYLRPPGEGSESALDFFHRQLSKAVRKKYLASEDDGVIIHRRLADCFYRKADPTADGMWKANDPRALSELPYHLSQAQRYDELFRIAGDETFLNAQASAFATEPDLQMETLRSAIKGAARIDSAAKMAEFVLAHARRLKEVYSESPLDALRAGNLERAWELADLSESEPCVLWLLLLACELKDAGQPDQARTTVIRLQQRHRPPMKDWKNELGGHLLRQLAEIWSEGANTTEAQDNAHLVDSLRDSLGVREFLKPAEASSRALDAPAGPGIDMPQTDFETAIEVAGSLDDKRDRAKAFCAFAVAQARAGEVESSRKNFSAAIESAFEIDDVWHEADEPEQGVKRLGYRAEALSEIAASQAQIGDFTAASTTARSIDENTHLVNA